MFVTAVIAPLLLHWLTRRSQGPKFARIEKQIEPLSNGFAPDVIHKLDSIESKVDDVVKRQSYAEGRFDQHIQEHKQPPPAV